MNDKEIREWYQANGMEYIAEDWDADAPQVQEPERHGGMRARTIEPNMVLAVHPHRTPEERTRMEALEDFFEPYISMLPRPKGELIRQLINDQKTYEAIRQDEGRASRGSTINAGKRALQALLRLIANDDPDFTPPADGRRRDYEAERAAAERVFARYWTGVNGIDSG